MTVRSFADTNIAVYAESEDGEKSVIAARIIDEGPVISTQVVNEMIAALSGKHGFTRADAYEVAAALMEQCEVVPTDEQVVAVTARVQKAKQRRPRSDALSVSHRERARACTARYLPRATRACPRSTRF